MFSGCERRKAAAPTTQIVSEKAPVASAEATSQPTSYILIDQQPYEFPPARIIFKTKDDQVTAVLFSDDPPAAIKENYPGNSFYLEMTPQLADDGTLAGATWDFKAPSSDRVDTVSGIYLRGRKQHLQPFDVHVVFGGAISPVPISISGSFLQFDSNDEQIPGKFVTVHAELSAQVKSAKGK